MKKFSEHNSRNHASVDRFRMRFLVSWLVLFGSLLQTAQAAAYATAGTGQYKDRILWLTWGGGANGTKGQGLTTGSSTSATLTLAGKPLVITCSLSNITGGTIKSYAPGGWRGDSLDDLYNIGGTGTSNTLVNGIVNGEQGSTVTFTVTCNATLDGKAYDLPGLVVSDAESMAPSEYLEIRATGTWNILEKFVCSGDTTYAATLSNSDQTLRFSRSGAQTNCDTTSNSLGVGVLRFTPAAYSGTRRQVSFDVSVKGYGLTAVALGLPATNLDVSDAPASYGQALHAYPPSLTADGLASGSTAYLTPTFRVSTFTNPTTNLLGLKVDADSATMQGNATATTDDITDINDEDGVNVSSLAPLNINSTATYLVPVACSGTGTVKGWLDFNLNGTFDSSESSQVKCTGGGATVNLTFPVPSGIKSGQSYLRLRYALDATELAAPDGVAMTGEVEDYALPIYSRVFLKKSWGLAVPGDTVTLKISGGGLPSPQTQDAVAKNSVTTSAPVIGANQVTVEETGAKVADYAATLVCTKLSDGSLVLSTSAVTASFAMPQDSHVSCELTNNLRMPNVPQMKKYVRAIPLGQFSTAGSAVPGTTLQYCISFQNTGNGPARKFRLQDAFPADTSRAHPEAASPVDQWRLLYSASGADLQGSSADPPVSPLPAGATFTVGTVNPSTGAQGIILDLGAGGLPSGGTGTVCFEVKVN